MRFAAEFIYEHTAATIEAETISLIRVNVKAGQFQRVSFGGLL
jgi:hypothetical protein